MHRFLREVEDILIKLSRNPAIELDDSEYSVPEKLLTYMRAELLKGVPFSYILEMSEFYNNQFYITPDVLIPRSETEQLVELIVNKVTHPVERMLDVGVGSGVILLSLLAQNVAKKGVGVDVSQKAIEVATINARRLRLLDRTEFKLSDRLFSVEGPFDLIVSNPPYIRASSHYELVHQQVKTHEPHLALFLEDHAYDEWFGIFFRQVYDHLKSEGFFVMEGHELEVEKQSQMLGEIGFSNIRVEKDLLGSPRFLIASRLH
ncbi:MAG: peptide chain release factor N(5)-glutamine methyltransferase [Bacteriovoracaceae bacterium]